MGAIYGHGQSKLTDSLPSSEASLPNFLDRSYLFNIEKNYPYRTNSRWFFEGQLAAYLLIYSNLKKEKPARYAITLTPEIRTRILHEFSFPMVTPSFLLHFRYIRQLKNPGPGTGRQYYVAGINHHSTGKRSHLVNQLSREGYLDTLNGNFSTHYLDFRYYLEKPQNDHLRHRIGIGFEEHLPDSLFGSEIPGGMAGFIAENYGIHRVILDYTLIYKLRRPSFLADAICQLRTIYSFSLTKPLGNEYHPELRDPGNLPRNRFLVEASLKPDWPSDFGFFCRFRTGQDHYNMFFFNRLTQFEFGLIIEHGPITAKKDS